jgi:hypothetical protein
MSRNTDHCNSLLPHARGTAERGACGKAFDHAWAMLKPELASFSASEIVSIRKLLARSIEEAAADQGEQDCVSLCILALQKVCQHLRADCRLELVS